MLMTKPSNCSRNPERMKSAPPYPHLAFVSDPTPVKSDNAIRNKDAAHSYQPWRSYARSASRQEREDNQPASPLRKSSSHQRGRKCRTP
jgi:hypothetical protein